MQVSPADHAEEEQRPWIVDQTEKKKTDEAAAPQTAHIAAAPTGGRSDQRPFLPMPAHLRLGGPRIFRADTRHRRGRPPRRAR